MTKQDLGHDVLNKRIIFEIMVTIVLLTVLSWLTINTVLWEIAQIFWVFGLMALVFTIIAFMIKKKDFKFDVPLSGKPLFNIPKPLLYLFFMAMFIVTFFVLSITDYSITAPEFQILEVGLGGNVMLTVAAAWMEDLFFFAVIPGILFSVGFWLSKRFWPSITLSVIISPVIFMVYHLAVYGFTNQVALVFLLITGLEWVIMSMLLRDITYVHVRHIGNNLGLLIFKQFSFTTFMIFMLTNIWIWVIAIIIILIIIYKYK